MAFQPGVGYTFTASSQGETINVIQPWNAFPIYTPEPDPVFVCAPFKVHDIVEVPGNPDADPPTSSYVTYEICPGTVNNIMPQVYNTVTEEWEYLDDLTAGYKLILEFSSGVSWIAMRAGKDAASGDFPALTPDGTPDDPYPRIISQGSDPAGSDSDLFGFVTIAKVTEVGGGVYTIDQYVTGSLWGDRLKLGSLTAKYYYARI